MNCKEVRDALWANEREEEVREHLETCLACREERESLDEMGRMMERTDIPVPKRSLLPSQAEIESVVRAHKRRRFVGFFSGGLAAAGVVAVLMLAPQFWPGSGEQPAQQQAVSKPLEEQFAEVFRKYGWTQSGTAHKESYLLPQRIDRAEGETPDELFWAYHQELGKAAGFDLTNHLGKQATVYAWTVPEHIPGLKNGEYADLATKLYLVESQGAIIGGWVRKEGLRVEAALDGTFFADITGQTWGDWLQSQGFVPDAAASAQEEAVQRLFAGISEGDLAGAFAQLTPNYLLNLMMSVPEADRLYAKTWQETMHGLMTIKEGTVKSVRAAGEVEAAYDPLSTEAKTLNARTAQMQELEVTANLQVTQEGMFVNGENVLRVTMVREAPDLPWRIEYIKGAH